ncbi:hypothetical protein ACG0Z6_03035 [Roseateles sp. BYS180W]|uniref:Uncharacterized protein n=1 Tax=Roseateles rivi TaxID=3299028 RepID=A0ABW7FSA3_9BURK
MSAARTLAQRSPAVLKAWDPTGMGRFLLGAVTVWWLLIAFLAPQGTALADLLPMALPTQSVLLVALSMALQARLSGVHRVAQARVMPGHTLAQAQRQTLRGYAWAWGVCALPLVLIDLRTVLQAANAGLTDWAALPLGPAWLAWLALAGTALQACVQGQRVPRGSLSVLLCGLGLASTRLAGLWPGLSALELPGLLAQGLSALYLLLRGPTVLRQLLAQSPVDMQGPLQHMHALWQRWGRQFQWLDDLEGKIGNRFVFLSLLAAQQSMVLNHGSWGDSGLRLPLLVFIALPLLQCRHLHWRYQLMPQAVTRHRLGFSILKDSLRGIGLMLLPLLLFAAVLGLVFQLATEDAADAATLWRMAKIAGSLALDSVLAIELAVVLRGYAGSWPRAFWLLVRFGVVILLSVLASRYFDACGLLSLPRAFTPWTLGVQGLLMLALLPLVKHSWLGADWGSA